MFKRHHVRVGFAGLVAAAVAGSTVAAAPAQAAPSSERAGERSLVKVLAADKGFDRNARDFDILEAVVKAVLKAKPDSPVGLLADGDTRLTAFLPTDGAFRALVKDLTGTSFHREARVTKALTKAVDVDTAETVLLYHVVAGKTLPSNKVVALNGERVKTAAGPAIKVVVKGKRVIIRDKDFNDRNAVVVSLDINRGNKQIGHGIDRVLRPADL